MKTDTLLFFGSLLFSMVLIRGSKPKEISYSNAEKAITAVNRNFQENLQAFYDECVSFSMASEMLHSKYSGTENIQLAYSRLRKKSKKVEFLLEYLDKEAYDKAVNGAPLPKLEQKVADLNILNPKGLQVLDELMGEELESEEKRKELSTYSKKLVQDVKNMKQFLQVRRINDRQFFEASRQAIVRLTTLGITGFDTPGTASGIQDATVVLQNLKKYLTHYEQELGNVGGTQLLSYTLKISERGIQQTSKADFENFNRLTFIKEVVHPIYKSIKDIHLLLDYETISEVSRYPLAVNYDADRIFDADFLNPFYFTSIANDSTYETKAALGKLLFYDPVLSHDNAMACVSCHAPEKAFTDGRIKSFSNKDIALKRNAMTLSYSGFAMSFFHDLRTKRLEDQFEHVVVSKEEFNSSYVEIMDKLKSSQTYLEMFEEAFPGQSKPIMANNIDYALAAYIMKLSSFDSSIDRYFQQVDEELPEAVVNGFNLFTGKANCASCHFMPLFSGLVPPLYKETEAEVLGVPKSSVAPWVLDEDLGRLGNGMTQDVAYFYKHAFKTPTLRNIAFTAPYMHNGVFATLEEVMDFYNEGGGVGRGMSLEHQTLAPAPLNLTPKEIKEIIAFMNALSDQKVFKAPEALPRDFEANKLNSRKLFDQ